MDVLMQDHSNLFQCKNENLSIVKPVCRFFLLFSLFLLIDAVGYAAEKPYNTYNVGISLYSPPVLLIETNEIRLEGLSVDLAELFSSEAGLSFKIRIVDNSDYLTAIENGNVDLIICSKSDLDPSSPLDLIETNIIIDRKLFVNKDCSTIKSIEDLPGHSLVVENGNFLSRFLFKKNQTDIFEAESSLEALKLLNGGRAQAFLYHGKSLNLKLLKEDGFSNIKIINEQRDSFNLVIAISKNKKELYNQVSSAYQKISQTESYRQFFNSWIEKETNYKNWDKKNFQYFFGKYAKFSALVIGSIFVAFLCIIFWNYALKSQVKKITLDLNISEKKYRDLIESSPDMINIVSKNGMILFSNKIAIEHLGYDNKTFTSLNLNDIVANHHKDKCAGFLNRVFSKNYANDEIDFLSKNGKVLHAEMVATLVNWGVGNEQIACCFSRDLSIRKQLEEKLIQSDRLATMGRMAAGIAHELNNPLGIVLTNASAVSHYEPTSEDFKESLVSIERNALRASKIIENLLTFTRPAPVNKNKFHFPNLIEECLLFLKTRIKKAGINIETDFSDESLHYIGDDNMIQQLIINLLLNAIQAIKNNGKIIIRLYCSGKGTDKNVVLEIEDNGIGIPKDNLTKIFDPFFTCRKENGFGLGLFISKIIAEKHGGIIKAKSLPGENTVMAVIFPTNPIQTQKHAI